MPYNDPERPKRLMIQMSEENREALKKLASKLETSMDKVVNQLIEDALVLHELK